MKLWIALGTVAAVVIAIIVAVLTATGGGPSEQQIQQALKPGHAYLFTSDGRPRFHVTKVIEAQPGWYVATIKLEDVQTEPGKVILRQANPPDGPLTVFAGPGTSFPPEYISLPNAVRKALQQ